MSEKKKLIIVGNKPCPLDCCSGISSDLYKSIIDSFDYVIRVNKMDNYGLTGTKTDALYLNPCNDFIEVFDGGNHKHVFPDIPKFYMTYASWSLTWRRYWLRYFTDEQERSIEFLDFIGSGCRERIGLKGPCSSILLIDYFSNKFPWSDKYDTYFTGLDVEDRGAVLSSGSAWKGTPHRFDGDIEGSYLKRMLSVGKIRCLERDILDGSFSGFSSDKVSFQSV